MKFIGANLRLARLVHGMSLAELGELLDRSKQYLSRLEAGDGTVSPALEAELVEALDVLPQFFYELDPMPIVDEQCHFRKQLTTKVALRQFARARGEMLKRLVAVLDESLDLPPYHVQEGDPSSIENIERAAERYRAMWELGCGPLKNLTRVAENAGAVVMRVAGLADEIDAVSFATKRPVIALNSAGRSTCRSRFAIAHELGHFVLHTGVLTGDRLTESQANRFASALMMPRSSFISECRSVLRGSRLSWYALSTLKLRWGVSKAAILYRGRQLDVFSEDQLRGGFIHLNRHGEAHGEREDDQVPGELPELVDEGLKVMREHFGMPFSAIARAMWIKPGLLQKLLGDRSAALGDSNVIPLFAVAA